VVWGKRALRIETLFADWQSRGFHIHKTRIKNPAILHNLLILLAIAFSLSLIMGQGKGLFKDLLPKIFRKD
jgi:hypothetical protein